MSPAERAGPPEREEPGATPSTGPNHKSGIAKPTNQARPIAAGRQCRRNTVGRHADAVISPDHLAMLAASGIPPEHAARAGTKRSPTTPARRAEDRHGRPQLCPRPAGAAAACRRLEVGLPVPARRPAAARRQAGQVRDAVAAAQRAGRPARRRADCSATRRYRCGSPRASRRPTAGRMHGLCIVALSGVWNWRGTNTRGGQDVARGLERHRTQQRAPGDPGVRRRRGPQGVGAARRLCALADYLAIRGARVEYLHLPDTDDKTGLDDYLMAGHTVEDLWRLVKPHQPPVPTCRDADRRHPSRRTRTGRTDSP